jgi:hypothetical protein
MAKKTYGEKLNDPRWQKKRLHIFERDNWACTMCGATDLTLHVHHEQYAGEPWEVADEHLKTLCAACHSAVEVVNQAGFKTISIKLLERESTRDSQRFYALLCRRPSTDKHTLVLFYFSDVIEHSVLLREHSFDTVVDILQSLKTTE